MPNRSPIDHVFVLMLENRSFDHLLGYSGLHGSDAETGDWTSIDGLTGTEQNLFYGGGCQVGDEGRDPMPVDPGHEFVNVLRQLCGKDEYEPNAPYPEPDLSGFVADYVQLEKMHHRRWWPWGDYPQPDDVMRCFNPAAVPNLTALAREFAVCDRWFSSMPGPTWPNRLFAVAGSSAGLDHTPTLREMAWWKTLRGFWFRNGTIFNRKISWRIYAGQPIFAFAQALRGVHIQDVKPWSDFAPDVSEPSLSRQYRTQFTWIEPSYGHVATNFKNGASQHPLDGIRGGEDLIKDVYEILRGSPVWERSLLIITWDEHGGFYDHVPPPKALPPRDGAYTHVANRSGFAFDRYGVRVPTVVVSPLIRRNVIDHRPYDHASLVATTLKLFEDAPKPLTQRDGVKCNDLLSLVSLDEPRLVNAIEWAPSNTDGPTTALDKVHVPFMEATAPGDRIGDEIGDPLPGFLYLATRAHLGLSSWWNYPRVLWKSSRVRTRGEARDYFENVRKLYALRHPLRNERELL